MQIFIAARVPRANIHQQAICEQAARAVQRSGHTPFLAYQEIQARGLAQARQFMPFVRDKLRHADLLVLLYDSDLRGGLIEAGMAYAWRKPIWLAHASDARVSSSVLGVAAQVIVYQDADGLEAKLYEYLCGDTASLRPKTISKTPGEEK